LKDIDRPERIAQLTADGLQLEFPPLRDAVVLPAVAEPPPLLRRRSLLAAVAAGVVAAAVAIPVFALAGGSGVSLSNSDSLVQIDPDQAKPVDSIKVPANAVGVADNAVGVATCLAFVFVPTLNGTVYEINPQTSKPYPIRVDGTPGAITNVGALAAVVTRPPTNSVSIIDAADAKLTNSFPLPGTPSALAALTYWRRVIWIANPNKHELERVGSPYTGISTDKSIGLPVRGPQTGTASRYEGVAGGAGSLWVSGNASNHTVWRVNPATRRVTPIPLAFAPGALTVGPGGVWVVDRQDNTVVAIDPATNRPGQKIAVGRGPIAVAASDQFVWVANKISGTITRIDPKHGTKRKITVGTNPIDVVYGLGSVWVAKRAS
jgi:YVTN family beta-propeller protein